MTEFNIIFLGDIVGRAGRTILKRFLPTLKNGGLPCVAGANAENSAAGFGLTHKVYRELISLGLDVLTGGNHISDKINIRGDRNAFDRLALPANLKETLNAVVHYNINGRKLSFINLVGCAFMPDNPKSPFETFDRLYEDECKDTIIFVDFHAEATSEKIALGEYIDGRATALFGTHTHVQTSDERILRKGTFFISDIGSCCAVNSILGMSVENSLARFIGGEKQKMIVELSLPYMLNGVKLTINDRGIVSDYKRIREVMYG
jgi:metallophosphoesterase (TIGR00282 family)